jgi:hypothetical protein
MHTVAEAFAFVQSIQGGLDRLTAWLGAEGYTPEATGRIIDHTVMEETPTGAPDLDPRDEEYAEHAFVEGQEPVAGVSAEWDEHSTEPGRGPVYNTVGADYTLDRLGWTLERLQDALADTETFPPNAGERKPGGPRVKIPVRKLPRI